MDPSPQLGGRSLEEEDYYDESLLTRRSPRYYGTAPAAVLVSSGSSSSNSMVEVRISNSSVSAPTNGNSSLRILEEQPQQQEDNDDSNQEDDAAVTITTDSAPPTAEVVAAPAASYRIPQARPVPSDAQQVLAQARQIQDRIREQLRLLQELQQEQERQHQRGTLDPPAVAVTNTNTNSSNSTNPDSSPSVLEQLQQEQQIRQELQALRELEYQNQQDQLSLQMTDITTNHPEQVSEILEESDGEDDNPAAAAAQTKYACGASLRCWYLVGAALMAGVVTIMLILTFVVFLSGDDDGSDQDVPVLPPPLQPTPAPTPPQILSDWFPLGTALAGTAEDDQFGFSVSLAANGRRVAVGARYHAGQQGPYQGFVHVYDNTGAAGWEQVGNSLFGLARGDEFGTAVALSGDGLTVVVGAPASDVSNFNSGQVRIFRWQQVQNVQSWIQVGSLDGENYADRFGAAVAVSYDGTVVAAGAEFHDAAGRHSGYVRVVQQQWNISSSTARWEPIGTLLGRNEGDWFGGALALSSNGRILAVGSVGNGDFDDRAGAVEVFQYDANDNAWNTLGEPLFGQEVADWFGDSIALSADGATVAASAPLHDLEGQERSDAGNVRVFRFEDNGWVQLGADLDGSGNFEQFGNSVSLSRNGNRVAVGAPRGQNAAGSYVGYVQTYEYDSQIDEWIPHGSPIEGGEAFGQHGWSVSLSDDGQTLASGAPQFNGDDGSNSGQARVFRINR